MAQSQTQKAQIKNWQEWADDTSKQLTEQRVKKYTVDYIADHVNSRKGTNDIVNWYGDPDADNREERTVRFPNHFI